MHPLTKSDQVKSVAIILTGWSWTWTKGSDEALASLYYTT